jgi:hypothetical protein
MKNSKNPAIQSMARSCYAPVHAPDYFSNAISWLRLLTPSRS